MASLKHLEDTIFQVEGVRVALSGKTPVIAEYWKRRFSQESNVADFKARFADRYPGLAVEVLDGVGMPAHGGKLLKNLRASYDYTWIDKEFGGMLAIYQELVDDQKRQIKALKKALRKSPKAAKVKTEEPDPYTVLNVTPDASDDAIKIAHRERIMALHPDRFEKFGDYLKKFATEKAQQINAARDEIARQRAPDAD